jgi:hypothetical protein
MPFYRDHVYPQLVRVLGDPRPIREVRQRIVRWAQGKVLEIGVGPGINFVHYDPAKVRKIYALEPNRGMVRLAERQRRRTELDVEFLGLPGERIPLDDDTVDTVVSTFTWQERSEPLTRWLFEGCHVTRDIPSLLEQSGFRTEQIETGYLAQFPRAWTHCWWGTAVPIRAAPPVAV